MTEIKKRNRRRGRNSGGGKSDEAMHGADNNVGGSVAEYKAHNSVLVHFDEENATWYDYGNNLPGRNDTITSCPPSPADQSNSSLLTKYRSIGDLIYQKEVQLFGRNSSGASDERWVENTMKKGTLKDRIAAMSVTVSTDPIHKFYSLDGLLSMVGCSESGGKTNSRVAQLTAEALEDLFINTFMPPNRKLLTMAQRPLYRYENGKGGKKTKQTLSPRILLLWRFEEMVKEKYDLYLRKYMAQTLQEGAEMHKIATLKSSATFLCSIPEGESQILAMLANKLGDPGKKVAAAAGHQLRNVLHQHPNMKIVIAREVQQLAHRPHLSPKALYNCIVFLNQIKLEKAEDPPKQKTPTSQHTPESLPASLVKTYFRLFEVAVKKNKANADSESEEAGMKSRLLSALLTGVNRAHPYLPEKDQDMEQYIDALYRVVHTAAPGACTQALMLLFHLAVGSQHENNNNMSDEPDTEARTSRRNRFYRALYATLSKPELISHGKHLTMYFNLLYKAMKSDSDNNRVNAFAKRLMCTVLHANAAPLAGCLFLLNEISKTHDGLRACIEAVPDEANAWLMLDETKREPSAALVSMQEDAGNNHSTRNPPCWELSMISHHFHPSVAKFSDTMGEIEFAGDPLKDFALGPFLDKFAYRNPKAKGNLNYRRGESVAERRSGTDRMIQHRLELPMNDPSFLEQEDVNEQDEFFHKFFTERARRDEIKGIERGKPKATEEEDEAAEEEALDAAEEAEGLEVGGKSFEEYERAWDTDSEEEAFVDSLAEQLLEDAAEGEADLDDEDPDTEDWGDMYGSDDEKMDKDDGSDDERGDDSDAEEGPVVDGSDDGGSVDNVEAAADDDDFMDQADSGDSSDSDDDASDGDSAEIDERAIQAGIVDDGEQPSDDDDSDDDGMGMLNDSDSDAVVDDPNGDGTFVDADDYEEMITKGWNELKRGPQLPPSDDEPKKKRKTQKSAKKKKR